MSLPTEITTAGLFNLIGTPDAPLIVDVRIDEDFQQDPFLIPTAFRWPYGNVEALADRARDLEVVVACQKGRKLSEGAAALLRDAGVAAGVLRGGTMAWREAGLPMIPAHRLPASGTNRGSLWVTRSRPKIDRIACPWLIRRFVDARARFLFVSPEEVADVAERFSAEPFDVEGVFWSHRGERCTFDTMIAEFGLETEPLLRLAEIVRGADTARPDLAPASAGLLAVSVGLSQMFRDDLKQVEAGMLIYDAFYRWLRDARDETHNWPAAALAEAG